jgi:glycine/D-amino acid oxidase-like deaminating enzyme
VSDLGNRFHYYRLTADDRILFGGFDAVYHYGRSLSAAHDQDRGSFRTLAAHFRQTFPPLEGLRFTHAWGGAIDTCTRFFPFFGTAHGGRVAHVAGYTGLGVAATRFAADVLLDLLAVEEEGPTGLTELELVRRRPPPFPPEPLAWAGVAATTRSLAHADGHGGRRNAWLRALDRSGLGFDS